MFSPQSDLVALIEPDGGATLWRTRTGRPASTLPGYGAGGPGGFSFDPGAAFSRDGRLLALANADGIVRVWELATRKQVAAVGAGWASELAFAPFGGRLAAMTWDGDLVVAEAPASLAIRTGFQAARGCGLSGPEPSPDGRWIVAPVRGGAGLWRPDGRLAHVLRPPAHPVGTAWPVEFGAGGSVAAALATRSYCGSMTSADRYGAGVWRVGRRGPLLTLPRAADIELAPNGRLLAVDGRVHATANGRRVRALDGVLSFAGDTRSALVRRGLAVRVVEAPSGRTVSVLDGALPSARPSTGSEPP